MPSFYYICTKVINIISEKKKKKSKIHPTVLISPWPNSFTCSTASRASKTKFVLLTSNERVRHIIKNTVSIKPLNG